MIKDETIPPVKRGGRTITVYAVIAVLLVSMVPATVAASAHNSHKLEVSFAAPHAAIEGQPITVKAWASGGLSSYRAQLPLRLFEELFQRSRPLDASGYGRD